MKPLRRKRIELTKLEGIHLVVASRDGGWVIFGHSPFQCCSDRCICLRYALRAPPSCSDRLGSGPGLRSRCPARPLGSSSVALLRSIGVPPSDQEVRRASVVGGGRVRPVFGGGGSSCCSVPGRRLGVKVGHLSDPS